MKTLRLFSVLEVVLVISILSSCTAIAGIFKAGMGFGMIVVLGLLVVIVGIAMKSRYKM